MPMAEGEKESSGRVFEGVRFAIIPSETLTDENSIKVRVHKMQTTTGNRR